MNKGRVSIFKDRLAKMEQQAAAAMADYTPGGVKVPDSIYNARVQAELTEAQSSGNLMIKHIYTVSEGEYKGLKAWDYTVLEKKDENGIRTLNDRQIQNARRWVESCGYAWPESIGDLEEVINAINDAAPLARIRLKTDVDEKTKDEFQHAKILELIAEEGQTEAAAEAQPAAEEPAAEAQPEGDELDGMTRAQLKQYIQDNCPGEIRVTIKTTDDEIRNMIREYYNQQPAAEEQPAEEDAAPEESAVDVNALLTFCASQGITEVEEGMEADAVVEVMKTYQYKKEELTDDEYQMLIGAGITETNIIAPPPKPTAKPAAAPKPAAPKPAAPAAKPPVSAPAAKPGAPKLGAGKPGSFRPGLKK